jgi:multidrug efflux pump subunit AcrA (membrane-fusion protein)
LKVDVGSEVQEGQVIAVLSHGTLDAELQQAQTTLLNAEAQLAKLRAGVGPNRIEAQARVDAARARLEQLISPSPLNLQVAASSVDKAQAELESARTQSDQLENPSEAELAAAQAAVADADSQLSGAQAAVNDAISKQLSAEGNITPSEPRLWWEILLRARLNLQSEVATLQNLQQTFDLDLS